LHNRYEFRLILAAIKEDELDIFKAARQGDLNALVACIQNGNSIDSRDSKDLTPLMWAVDMGQEQTVKYLVDNKANLNLRDQYGQTAVILAAGRNDIKILQILITAKADLNVKMITGVTALTLALENKHNESAALLKKVGAK
jgi:ankyrin repeat protein